MAAFNLGQTALNKVVTNSTMTFGGFNASQFEGELNWHTQKTDKWWAVQVNALTYGRWILRKYGDYD
jgi:hypothetical protein